MTVEAALPAPDQWERDLTELLGLNDAGVVSVGAGHGRALRVAMVLTALALIALCFFEVRRRSASPMAGPLSVTQVIAERSSPTRPTVIVAEPSAPAASIAPVAPAIRMASRTIRHRHSVLKPAFQDKQANSVTISRASVASRATLFDTSHLRRRSGQEPLEITVPSIQEARRSDDGDKAFRDDRDRPLPIAREPTSSYEEARGGEQPLPPSQRPRFGERKFSDKKTEAIDAIRLLRRQ